MNTIENAMNNIYREVPDLSDEAAQSIKDSFWKNYNEVFNVDQEKQTEDRLEAESAQFDALLEDTIEEIKACDMEFIFKHYSSCFASVYTLYYDASDLKERLDKEIEDCIWVEAKERVENRLGGE
jgi:hypothetical protein